MSAAVPAAVPPAGQLDPNYPFSAADIRWHRKGVVPEPRRGVLTTHCTAAGAPTAPRTESWARHRLVLWGRRG